LQIGFSPLAIYFWQSKQISGKRTSKTRFFILIKKRIIVIIVADMFDFLSRSTLGVDIGTASIKIVEIAKSLPKPKLKNYGILRSRTYLERPNSAIQTNSLKILEKETADLLRILVKKAKFKSRNAVASIPSFSAFTTLLEMPIMSGVDVSKTMPFQIRQHIPLPVSEVAIDWMKVGEKEYKNKASSPAFGPAISRVHLKT